MLPTLVAATVMMLTQLTDVPADLLTIAEASQYQATCTSDEALALIDRIKARSSVMRVVELGRTVENRPIPLVLLADPPVATADEARASGKPVCFIMANIHAGEVEGKEACLRLIREIALDPRHLLLRDLVIAIAPNYNADGNDRFDEVAKNRPGQVGPARCGVRPNAQGFDLNRDYIKLEAPESQALARFLSQWDPHLTIDCHTTNGSHHRYVLTYEAPLNPSGHPGPIKFVRETLLPKVTRRVKEKTGYDMWHYGNFNRDHTVWSTYSAQPRFGGPYQGLRGQMSVLSEAYSYASYKDRVLATHALLTEVLTFVAEHKDQVIDINRTARADVVRMGRDPGPDDIVGIRHRIAAFDQPAIVKGFAHTAGKGGEGGAAILSHADLGPPHDYRVVHCGRFEPTLSVRRPYGYLVPPGMDHVIAKLHQHGIQTEPFTGEAMIERYTITGIDREEREFQGHRTVTLEVTSSRERRIIPAGFVLIRTAQPLGTLAMYLLEPQSEDGLATWNFFDAQLKAGGEFPVLRVANASDLEALGR